MTQCQDIVDREGTIVFYVFISSVEYILEHFLLLGKYFVLIIEEIKLNGKYL